jgi:transcriptional antiterminator RfaH
MPLLPQEPSVYPEDLLGRPGDEAEEGACWAVVHTKPRAEKALARLLLHRGVAYFLPLHRRRWRNRGRLFESHLPLFPGYLFLHGDAQARLAALETNLVAHWLPVEDQQQLYADLVRVHELIATGAPLTPEDKLRPGTRVAILRGPLAGLEGKVLRRGKHLKFFVEVQFLQQGVSVEIESWMIEAVGGE